MAVIKCKMCGGDIQLSEDKTFGVCEFCGSTMTFPKVADEQRLAMFNRGNHFRRVGEFDKAMSIYETLVREDDTDAEAHWCCALCRFGIEYVEDPASHEFLPTCHRASYDSFLEDIDYAAALKYSDGVTRRQYERDAAKIEEVRRGILTTSQNEAPFDVFICYKETDDSGRRTVDSTLAQDIYYQLTEQGRRVFFARITLEDKAGLEYEPYIFSALNSAKVMVVVGTRPEHFNAVWVKNEWSRFLSLMKGDRKKLLLPCYRDMDPYELPDQLAVLQSYDMSKIGFIQDLTRGIAKVLDADKSAAPRQETVIVQEAGGGSAESLLKRGRMALEDKDWDKADAFFEQVLNLDPECGEAYFGKALAARKLSSMDEFIWAGQQSLPKQLIGRAVEACPENTDRIAGIIQKSLVPNYFEGNAILSAFQAFNRTFTSMAPSAAQALNQANAYFYDDKLIARAIRYASGDFADRLKSAQEMICGGPQKLLEEAKAQDAAVVERILGGYAAHLDAAERRVEELFQDALSRREKDYRDAQGLQTSAKTQKQFQAAAAAFERVGPYLDGPDRVQQCAAAAVTAGKKARARMRRRLIAAIAGVLAAAVLTVTVIVPGYHYMQGMSLSSQGNNSAAAIAFGKAGRFLDAAVRSESLWKENPHCTTMIIDGSYIVFGVYAVREDNTVLYLHIGSGGATVTEYPQSKAVVSIAQVYGGAFEDGVAVLYSDGTVGILESNEKYPIFRDVEKPERDPRNWSDITALFSNGYYLRGLKADGTVVTTVDEPEIESWQDITTIIIDYGIYGLKADGTVVTTNTAYQEALSSWTDIVDVNGADEHIVGLRSDGTVVAVESYDSYGACDIDGWTDIVAIDADYRYTVGLRSDGTLVSAGRYAHLDELGQNCSGVASFGSTYKSGRKLDGTFYLNNEVLSWTDVVELHGTEYFLLGLRSDGSVVTYPYTPEFEDNLSNIKLPH